MGDSQTGIRDTHSLSLVTSLLWLHSLHSWNQNAELHSLREVEPQFESPTTSWNNVHFISWDNNYLTQWNKTRVILQIICPLCHSIVTENVRQWVFDLPFMSRNTMFGVLTSSKQMDIPSLARNLPRNRLPFSKASTCRGVEVRVNTKRTKSLEVWKPQELVPFLLVHLLASHTRWDLVSVSVIHPVLLRFGSVWGEWWKSSFFYWVIFLTKRKPTQELFWNCFILPTPTTSHFRKTLFFRFCSLSFLLPHTCLLWIKFFRFGLVANASFPGSAGKMTGECWWLRDATEPAHSLSASQNLKFIPLWFHLLSSRFIVVVGLGNNISFSHTFSVTIEWQRAHYHPPLWEFTKLHEFYPLFLPH